LNQFCHKHDTKILLRRSNQGGWEGRDMWHVWG